MTATAPRRAGSAVPHHRVVVIGAGIAGVGLGVRLRQGGIEDFVILERNASVGGTWFEHTYPGCGCDVPANLYSYSFARNPRWTRMFPRQDEILRYVQDTADEYGVTPHVRFNCEMEHSSWTEADGRWHVRTADGGRMTADLLISAIGATAEPEEPEIVGLDSFTGHRFHSARWDHSHDLRGQRVAVIGTGPAAAQFVPRIQPDLERLLVFQRTAPWVIPHVDRPVPWLERRLYKLLPALQDVQRNALFAIYESIGIGFRGQTALIAPVEALGRAHLRRQVSDSVLRAKLTPHYRFGCKRPILSNTYNPALAADNADVICERITKIDRDAIVTADGERHRVDTIITAIGYKYSRSLLAHRISGLGERTLGEVWNRSPKAYLGSAVPGFPNMFILLGPNSIGINSVIFSLESQIAYVMSALETMERRGVARIEVRHEALEGFVNEVDQRSLGSVWTAGGCKAYYLDETGRNFGVYPGFAADFRRRTRRFDVAPYKLGPAAAGAEAA